MVWEKIKTTFTKGQRVGSVGYQKQLATAAILFVNILPSIKNNKKEETIFNADEEVREALINKKEIDNLFTAL